MKKVGITGGIGSGKTTVCRIFQILGIPVYSADDRAKELMTDDKELRRQITTIFGEKAYTADGSLDRKHLSSIVFSDKNKLKELEAVVHPAIHHDGENWHKSQKNVPYTLKEAALLIENGSYKAFDKMIMVYTPEEMRIERVMARDNTPREAVEARIKAQMSDEEKKELCDFVIYNDGKKGLIMQVLAVHKMLIA